MDRFIEFLLNFESWQIYAIIFGVLLLCGLGLPMPEDIPLVAAGTMAYYGVCNVWVTIAIAFAGVIGGDSIIFWLGHKYGRAIARKRLFSRMLSEQRLDEVGERFRTKGARLLFAARFMPGLRAPIFFSSGTLHVPYRTFLFYDGSAALASVPLLVGVAYYYGEYIDNAIRWIQRAQYGIVVLIFGVLALIGIKWYAKQRGLKRAG